MSKTKRWIRQILNLATVAMVLWLVLSIMEIGFTTCAIANKDYSIFNLITLLFNI